MSTSKIIFTLDINYRFTCGKSKLYFIVPKFQILCPGFQIMLENSWILFYANQNFESYFTKNLILFHVIVKISFKARRSVYT